MREELIELIGFEMQDPRLLPVEVNHVNAIARWPPCPCNDWSSGRREGSDARLSPALEHAQTLSSATNWRERLSLRRVPELHFAADLGAESLDRIELLLQRARKTRGEDEKQSSK